MKVELTRENWRCNTVSKGYLWLLVQKIYGIASKIQMLSVEAVWVMPFVTGCHTLSTPIRKANHNISDGGRTRYTFAASFNGWKREGKTINSTKVRSKFFMATLNLSTPWQKSGKLGFGKKNEALWNWQKILINFGQFRQHKIRCISKQGPNVLRQFFLWNKMSILLHLSSL